MSEVKRVRTKFFQVKWLFADSAQMDNTVLNADLWITIFWFKTLGGSCRNYGHSGIMVIVWAYVCIILGCYFICSKSMAKLYAYLYHISKLRHLKSRKFYINNLNKEKHSTVNSTNNMLNFFRYNARRLLLIRMVFSYFVNTKIL